ncbi:hypothetical protein BLA29_006437, partial [Euroglyphus maynei]
SNGRNRSNTVSVIGEIQSKRFIKFDRYKTELCIYKSEIGECPYGDQCCFAHGRDEIRPRPLHDCKERTQPCESFSKGVCYRGSSRCWYLHPKPEFNIDRLRNDLKHWLFNQKFQPNLFRKYSNDWFEDEWNPIFHDPLEYRSLIDQPFTDDDSVDFGDEELNEYFDFHRNYYPIFKEIMKSLSMIEKKPESMIGGNVTNDSLFNKNDNPTYHYNWSRAGTIVPDHIIRNSFYSSEHPFCDTTINDPNRNDESDESPMMIGELLTEISRLNFD